MHTLSLTVHLVHKSTEDRRDCPRDSTCPHIPSVPQSILSTSPQRTGGTIQGTPHIHTCPQSHCPSCPQVHRGQEGLSKGLHMSTYVTSATLSILFTSSQRTGRTAQGTPHVHTHTISPTVHPDHRSTGGVFHIFCIVTRVMDVHVKNTKFK